MKTKLTACLVILLGLLPACSPAPTRTRSGAQSLKETAPAMMLLNGDRDERPYFRVGLNLVDGSGAPIPIPLPESGEDLKRLIEIEKDGKITNPFYVSVADSESGQRQGGQTRQASSPPQQQREAMLLVDISGSMCQPADAVEERGPVAPCENLDGGGTRFNAAKAAAAAWLDNFKEGVDSFAVVPFESRKVRERIRAARFVSTRAEVLAQINDLPPPTRQSNTALYSAVVEAVRIMKERRQREGVGQQMLVILSDGENYVSEADKDAAIEEGGGALLSREEDLEQVQRAVREANLTTHTIGFGQPKRELERVLRAIANPPSENYSVAENPQKLKAQVQRQSQSFANMMRITFATDDKYYKALTTEVRFKVRFKSPLPVAESREIVYRCRTTNDCLKDDDLDKFERAAIVPDDPVSWWKRAYQPLLIFTSFSVLLALFWFGPPRLMWPRPVAPTLPGVHGGVGRAGDLLARVRRKPDPPPRQTGGASATPRKRFDETVILNKKGRGNDPGAGE